MYKLRQNDNQLIKFKTFNKNIRNCPITKKERKPELNICLNIDNCVEIRLPYIMFTYGSSKKDCRCNGKYAHKCRDYFCGLTKQDCDLLMKSTDKTFNTIIKNKCV